MVPHTHQGMTELELSGDLSAMRAPTVVGIVPRPNADPTASCIGVVRSAVMKATLVFIALRCGDGAVCHDGKACQHDRAADAV
jgi:hypothetical protein